MNYLTDLKKIDQDNWRKFVYCHPNGNIFHTPEIITIYGKSKNYEPIVIACKNNQGQMQGLVTGALLREYPGLAGKLTSRAICWGGPLVTGDNIEIAGKLLQIFDSIAQKNAVYSQYRNLWDISPLAGCFTSQGYAYEEHLNILINLTLSKEELWKNLHPKRRNEIRKAEQKGTYVKEIQDKGEFQKSYAIIRDVYKRVKLPVPSFSFFSLVWDTLGEGKKFRCFGAYNNNGLIGTMYVLCYKETIYDWYAGSYAGHYHEHPNDVLPWAIFLWGKEAGFRTFDFGGAGKPNVKYGVRDYKMKYGGSMVNYGRYEKIHRQVIMTLARFGFNLWKKIR